MLKHPYLKHFNMRDFRACSLCWIVWIVVIDVVQDHAEGADELFKPYKPDTEISQTIHAALKGRSIRLMWYSSSSSVAVKPVCSYTLHSSTGTLAHNTEAGVSYSYSASFGGFHGTLHDVVLWDVVPPFDSAQVWNLSYQCRDHSEFTEPEQLLLFSPATGYEDVAIALVADMGVLESEDTMQSINAALRNDSMSMSMLVHVGDISYADDRPAKFNSAVWKDFLGDLQPFPRKALYMTGPGNHESQFNFTAYHNWFHMPYEESNSPSPDYYSFDHLGVHFTMISTEMDFMPGSPQYAWLEHDLREASRHRHRVPWLVVTGHRPLYCTSILSHDRCTKEAPLYRSYIEQLLYKHDVDVYLSGHNHQYERTYPMFNGTATAYNFKNPTAPVYIVNGAAGNIEGNDRTYLPQAVVPWRAFHGTHHTGWLRMVPSRNKLSFVYTQSKGNVVWDSFEIVRKHADRVNIQ